MARRQSMLRTASRLRRTSQRPVHARQHICAFPKASSLESEEPLQYFACTLRTIDMGIALWWALEDEQIANTRRNWRSEDTSPFRPHTRNWPIIVLI